MSDLYTPIEGIVSSKGFKRRIAVDFDGCCAPIGESFYELGDPLPGSKEVLSNLRALGYYVVLFTSRTNTLNVDEIGHQEHGRIFETMLRWLEKNDFPYDEIYLGRGKPPCAYFIDDRAFSFVEEQSKACWDTIMASILKYRGKEWR